MKFIIAFVVFAIYLIDGHMSIPLGEEDAVKSENSTLIEDASRQKRGAYYPYYNSWFYPYHTYVQTTFVAAPCGHYSCPSGCPGTCGTYSGLFACKCTRCAYVGDVCNVYNINRGVLLHAYPLDHTRYVQCDRYPGVFYIRTCAHGLVFDARFGVCGQPSHYYIHGKK